MFTDEKNPLVGKTLTAVYVAKDKGAIQFVLAEGEPIHARADGDCCSHTWIENIQGVDQILNSPIVRVESIEMPEDPTVNQDEYDVIQFYGCKITSEKGFCVIDYRNSSNGYYGGSLAWPGDYFYGGVFDQNNSKEEWEVVE